MSGFSGSGGGGLVTSTQASSDTEDTTSEQTLQTKLTMNYTPAVTGDYILSWSCEVTNAMASQGANYQVDDGSTTFAAGTIAPTSGGDYKPVAGFTNIALTAGVAKSFNIKYDAVNETAWIRRARLLLLRRT